MRTGRLRDGLVLAALVVYAMPFFWQALTSARPDAELLPLSHLLPSRLTLVHYDAVLRQSLMPRALLNSLGIALSSTLLAVGLGALAGFIREIPRALEEAAAVDGAGRLAALRFVVLPLVAPGMASAALLAFLFSWNEFLFAYSFTATEASRTVPVALALFPGVFEVPWGDIAAASLLASLPPILIVVAFQRYLVRGLLAGALRE